MSAYTNGKPGKTSPPRVAKRKPARNITRLMLDGREIDQAIKEATREALEFHMRMGNPVVVWEDGKVVWRSAAEVLAKYPKRRRVTKSRG